MPLKINLKSDIFFIAFIICSFYNLPAITVSFKTMGCLKVIHLKQEVLEMNVGRIVANAGLGIVTKFDANQKFEKVAKFLPEAVDEFVLRANKPGQFLNWVDLPQKQMARVDSIYEMVDALKNQTKAKVLTVLGIGGSKHTVEHMLGVNGLNIKKDKVLFFSDIDSASFNRYMKHLDGDVTNSNFLVVSKSGSTFETKDGMLRVMDKLTQAYKNAGMSDDAVKKQVGKHFVAVTDKNAAKSELRRLSQAEGWLGDLFIHDDVGGRFSALDDHALFSLAYAGMKKEDMTKMLQGAQDMSKLALSKNEAENIPLMQAAFWSNARMNGVKDSAHLYLGDIFSDTATWHTQMQNESIKDSAKQITKITDAMHHSSEAWYNPKNKYTFALTAPVDKGAASENVEGYIGAVQKANSESGASMVELLDATEYGLKPQTAGAMSQARSFATVYQDIIEVKAQDKPLPSVLDSVLQPNVEFYKKNLKPIEGNQPPVVAGRISLNG